MHAHTITSALGCLSWLSKLAFPKGLFLHSLGTLVTRCIRFLIYLASLVYWIVCSCIIENKCSAAMLLYLKHSYFNSSEITLSIFKVLDWTIHKQKIAKGQQLETKPTTTQILCHTKKPKNGTDRNQRALQAFPSHMNTLGLLNMAGGSLLVASTLIEYQLHQNTPLCMHPHIIIQIVSVTLLPNHGLGLSPQWADKVSYTGPIPQWLYKVVFMICDLSDLVLHAGKSQQVKKTSTPRHCKLCEGKMI